MQEKDILISQDENVEIDAADESIPDFSAEISALKDEGLYKDIDTVSSEISDFAAKKGISAKEAYNALFGEARAVRLMEEMQKMKSDFHKKSRKIPALSSGSGYRPRSEDISGSERLAAKLAGISDYEYLKYKNK